MYVRLTRTSEATAGCWTPAIGSRPRTAAGLPGERWQGVRHTSRPVPVEAAAHTCPLHRFRLLRPATDGCIYSVSKCDKAFRSRRGSTPSGRRTVLSMWPGELVDAGRFTVLDNAGP